VAVRKKEQATGVEQSQCILAIRACSPEKGLSFKTNSKVNKWRWKKSWVQHNEKSSDAERTGRVQKWQGRVDLTWGMTEITSHFLLEVLQGLVPFLLVQTLTHLCPFTGYSGQFNKVFFFTFLTMCL